MFRLCSRISPKSGFVDFVWPVVGGGVVAVVVVVRVIVLVVVGLLSCRPPNYDANI